MWWCATAERSPAPLSLPPTRSLGKFGPQNAAGLRPPRSRRVVRLRPSFDKRAGRQGSSSLTAPYEGGPTNSAAAFPWGLGLPPVGGVSGNPAT